MTYRIAVVGATGNVGSETLRVLAERNFPIAQIHAIASKKSVGREVSFGEDRVLPVEVLESTDFKNIDIAFFSAGSKVSALHAERAVAAGAIVIDKTSHFRMEHNVPLIVPEVNLEHLSTYKKRGIISNPNCVAIPLAMALKPLDQIAPITRVVVSTYQSVSGAGKAGMDELYRQTKSIFVNETQAPEVFSKPIAFNVIPQIGGILGTGMTGEEDKVIMESRKILGTHIKMAVTCVRVPVFIGHAMSVTIEFSDAVSESAARAALTKAPGILVADNRENNVFATSIDCVGDDRVMVSRIRKDPSVENGLSLWVVVDNLRKGAALNAVQIAEALIKNGL